jgi:SAM-dependent methyltransferase
MKLGKAEECLNPDKPVRYGYYQLVINRYVFASRFIIDKLVLDLGCGRGYGSAYLTTKGGRLVVGGDYNRDAIYYCKNRYQQAFLHYICFDATHLPFRDNSFDVVVCFDVIEHVVNPRRLLAEARRILRDRGIFICSTPNKECHTCVPKTPYHVYEFSVKEFYNLLEKYFDNVIPMGQVFLDNNDIVIEKWRSFMGAIGATVLSHIPFGDEIKQKITRFILKENYRVKFRENFDDMVSDRFRVLPFIQKSSKIPKHLVGVAEVHKCESTPKEKDALNINISSGCEAFYRHKDAEGRDLGTN